jgi:hypothetical protein
VGLQVLPSETGVDVVDKSALGGSELSERSRGTLRDVADRDGSLAVVTTRTVVVVARRRL